MKNIFIIASTALLSLLSFAAIAGSSTPATPEKMIQENTEKQLAAEREKYTWIVEFAGTFAGAGNRQDELAARKNEVTSTYKKWYDLKSDVVSHYPSYKDYQAVEIAAKSYSNAYKAFIDLQKSILAQYGLPPLEMVAANLPPLEMVAANTN